VNSKDWDWMVNNPGERGEGRNCRSVGSDAY